MHRGSRSQFMRGLLAARLDPEKRYGIWWFNRRHYASSHYASKQMAAPVPDSGIPCEWIDAARDSIKDNKRPSTNAERFWELSGGVTLCTKCGCRMVAHTSHEKKSGNTYHYYMYPKRKRHDVHAGWPPGKRGSGGSSRPNHLIPSRSLSTLSRV
jgi:hypothetical protein